MLDFLGLKDTFSEKDLESALPRTPPLGPAHLCVELPAQRFLHRDERLEMRPAQLSPQCRDNLRIRKCLRELDHPAKVLLFVPSPVASLQLSPQRGDNLGAVFSPSLLEDVLTDAGSNLPVQSGQGHVCDLSDLPSRRFDQMTEIRKQRIGRRRFRGSARLGRRTNGQFCGRHRLSRQRCDLSASCHVTVLSHDQFSARHEVFALTSGSLSSFRCDCTVRIAEPGRSKPNVDLITAFLPARYVPVMPAPEIRHE